MRLKFELVGWYLKRQPVHLSLVQFYTSPVNKLLHNLQSIHPLSESCRTAMAALLKTKVLPKKEHLLREGQICQSIYFIEEGLLRCYYHQGDQEVCSWFMREGDVMISVESFFQQKQSYEAIQALEDSLLYYIRYDELQKLYQQFPEFNFVARVLTEKYYCLSEQRLYAMRMMRSRERYQFLLTHYPELVLRVPAKYIASYLGLTEVTLSKIKSQR